KRKLLNILIVFAISGLWHGAALTFVVWGLWHALLRIGDELLSRALGSGFSRPKGVFRVLRVLFCDLMVALGWVLFRAPDFESAWYVVSGCFKSAPLSGVAEQLLYLASRNVSADTPFYLVFFGGLFFGLILLVLFDRKTRRRALEGAADACNPLAGIKSRVKWPLCIALGLCVMFFYIIAATRGAQNASFIYGGF
ncbi:MAG: MBOAT family O-acyltransferase, partial [Oscillospiraceae bacterium]|nr:MBOAT family O-acyltransferase [Oscillospiraceae bacterium]